MTGGSSIEKALIIDILWLAAYWSIDSQTFTAIAQWVLLNKGKCINNGVDNWLEYPLIPPKIISPVSTLTRCLLYSGDASLMDKAQNGILQTHTSSVSSRLRYRNYLEDDVNGTLYRTDKRVKRRMLIWQYAIILDESFYMKHVISNPWRGTTTMLCATLLSIFIVAWPLRHSSLRKS